MTEKTIFYTNVQKRGDNIYLRYKTNTGETYKQKVPFKPSLYITTNNTEDVVAHSIIGEPLSEIKFDSIKSANDFIENYRGVDGFKVFGQRDMAFQFISKFFGDKDEYHPEYIKRNDIDIEVFSGSIDKNGKCIAGPFPDAQLANYPVSAITFRDSLTETFHVFGLEYFDGHYLGTFDISKLPQDIQERLKNFKIEYKGFKDEESLLKCYIEYWEKTDCDYASGWNNIGFDQNYLANRIKQVLGEVDLKRLSPWGYIGERTRKTKFGDENIHEFFGCPWIDYQDVMQKHGFISPDNWKLGTVAQLLIGEGKLDYADSKNLNTLYVDNYNRFIAYNIIDTALIYKMDAKKGLFPLMLTLQYLWKCNLDDTLATIRPWSAYTYNRYTSQKIQPEIKGVYENRDFIGGYVREPKIGKHGWCVSVDANSLNI